MSARSINFVLVEACLILTALLIGGHFGVVRPWQLRVTTVMQGFVCGLLAMYSLIRLGWIPVR